MKVLSRGSVTCIYVLIALFFIGGAGGCKYVNVKPSSPEPCIDKTAYPNSVILNALEDPCKPYKILASVAKTAMVMDQFVYDDFHNKAASWISDLSMLNEISASSVKDVILIELTKVNAKTGVAVFILSDTFLEFSNEELLNSDDIEVLILAIKGIDAELAKLSNLMR